MYRTSCHSVALIFLLINITCWGQDTISCDTVIVKSYSNQFVLDGRNGKAYHIPLNANYSSSAVVVHWGNGYTAYGRMVNHLEFGRWYVFDRKNRLREFMLWGPEAMCVVHRVTLNKVGMIISESKLLTPCF